MEMRSVLRRIYCTAINAEVYGPVLVKLGFRLISEAAVTLDGNTYHTAMLDFGPKLLVDGWMAGHVRAELGLDEQEILDRDAREIVFNESRISLTPLEFGVMAYLHDNEDKAVTRTELLNEVWGYKYEGGSNVVDARIWSLRKKLGEHAWTIETVTGTLDSAEGEEAVREVAGAILDDVFYGPGLMQIESLVKEITLQVIDHMKDVVSVKKWALPDDQQKRPPMPWEPGALDDAEPEGETELEVVSEVEE